MRKAIIIGGGVAGPATALFLQRAGWDVEVFEAADAPAKYPGLFLNMATNGLAVLEELGLRNDLTRDGHRAGRMVMSSRTGREIGVVPNGPAGDLERGGVVVTRSHLHDVLRGALTTAGIEVAYCARLTSIAEHSTGVTAEFADGRRATGDIVVGCDGINSATRGYVAPDAPEPRYTGLIGFGGFARVPGLLPTPETQHMVFGSRAFFGYLVRDDGLALWFANVTEADPSSGRALSPAAWRARLTALYADDPRPVPDLIAATEDDLIGYPIYDLPRVTPWSRGRAVLVGDAVHATSPSAGQGSSLALEDAITLARCVRDHDDVRDAFAEYERLRAPRAREIVRYARAVDSQKRVTKSRLGVAIRDAMMPRFLAKASTDTRNDYLYNHRVEWDAPVS